MLSEIYDYVSDIIDVVIQIDNPTLLHVKTLTAMLLTLLGLLLAQNSML